MKHWLRFLSDVGRPLGWKADEQERLLMRMESLEKQLALVKEEYELNEKDIQAQVSRDWTEEEIQSAKNHPQEYY